MQLVAASGIHLHFHLHSPHKRLGGPLLPGPPARRSGWASTWRAPPALGRRQLRAVRHGKVHGALGPVAAGARMAAYCIGSRACDLGIGKKAALRSQAELQATAGRELAEAAAGGHLRNDWRQLSARGRQRQVALLVRVARCQHKAHLPFGKLAACGAIRTAGVEALFRAQTALTASLECMHMCCFAASQNMAGGCRHVQYKCATAAAQRPPVDLQAPCEPPADSAYSTRQQLSRNGSGFCVRSGRREGSGGWAIVQTCPGDCRPQRHGRLGQGAIRQSSGSTGPPASPAQTAHHPRHGHSAGDPGLKAHAPLALSDDLF